MMSSVEIRFVLEGVDAEKFKEVKEWLKQRTNTGVFRALLDEKYQEIKKLQFNSKEMAKTSS